jgi:hypothetical protein
MKAAPDADFPGWMRSLDGIPPGCFVLPRDLDIAARVSKRM